MEAATQARKSTSSSPETTPRPSSSASISGSAVRLTLSPSPVYTRYSSSGFMVFGTHSGEITPGHTESSSKPKSRLSDCPPSPSISRRRLDCNSRVARTAPERRASSSSTMSETDRSTSVRSSKFEGVRQPSAESVTLAEPTRHRSSTAKSLACRSLRRSRGIDRSSAASRISRSLAPERRSAGRHRVTMVVSIPLGIASSSRTNVCVLTNGAAIRALRDAEESSATRESPRAFTTQLSRESAVLPCPSPSACPQAGPSSRLEPCPRSVTTRTRAFAT